MATVTTFRTRFPEFVDQADVEVTQALSYATRLHAISEDGTLLCTAHLLALSSGERPDSDPEADGGAGVVTRETIGPRTIDYLTMAGKDERRAFYATTFYGRLLLAIEDRMPRRIIGAAVVG